MFEAATGRLPYDNFNDGRLPQLFDTSPRAATLAPISPALDALIMRCLDRSASARPSMRAVAAALRGSDEERITEDAGPRIAAAPPGRRRVWPFALAGALALGAVAYAAWPRASSSGAQPASPQSAPAAPVVAAPPAASIEPAPAPPTARAEPDPTPPTASAEPAPVAQPSRTPPRAATHPKSHAAPKRKASTTQGETLD
jgi:hypothetical protein